MNRVCVIPLKTFEIKYYSTRIHPVQFLVKWMLKIVDTSFPFKQTVTIKLVLTGLDTTLINRFPDPLWANIFALMKVMKEYKEICGKYEVIPPTT